MQNNGPLLVYVIKVTVPSNSQKILFGAHCLLKKTCVRIKYKYLISY